MNNGKSQLIELKKLAWVVFLFSIGYQLACALQSAPFLLQHALVLDDAFYYLQVARNTARLGWVTFDGIHATSGVQFVWGAILIGLAAIFSGRMQLLHAMLVLSVLLNAVSGLLLYRLGRAFRGTEVGSIALILWSGCLLRLMPNLMGMEYSLHIVVILCTISVWWRILIRPEGTSWKTFFYFGTLLMLNFWVRMDSAAYSFMILLSTAAVLYRIPGRHKFYFKRLSISLGIMIIGIFVYVMVYHHVSGTFAPISGLAKSYYASQYFNNYGSFFFFKEHIRWYFQICGRAILNILIPIHFAGAHYGIRHWVIIFAAALSFITSSALIYKRRLSSPSDYNLARFLFLLQIFGLLHVALVVATIGHFSWISQHYYGWLFISLCLSAALIFSYLLSMLQSERIRWIIAIFSVVIFLFPHSLLIHRRAFLPYKPNLNNRRLQATEWINSHMPPDARIGAWNAGVLAYFADRTVINLDGLTNDRTYLEFLKSGKNIKEYLLKEDIEYLSDVNFHDMSMKFGQTWDTAQLFRGSLNWNILEILYQDSEKVPVFVLRLKKNTQ